MVLRGRLLDNIAHPTRRGEGMGEETLFELPAIEERPGRAPTAPEEARVVRPMRHQLEWAAVDLESLLAQDHPARVIWGFVERLDLSAFYGPIRAVVERPGRPTTDPPQSRVPGSGVRGRGSGERETTASSLAGKEESSRKEDNSGQGKDGPAGAIAQGGNGR